MAAAAAVTTARAVTATARAVAARSGGVRCRGGGTGRRGAVMLRAACRTVPLATGRVRALRRSLIGLTAALEVLIATRTLCA